MLSIYGSPDNHSSQCNGVTRRDFIKIGGMAAGGLCLSQLLALEAKAATGRSHKAIINIFLPGGPSHIDMFDLKPDAPAEIRGEFGPIRTNVPGIQICEQFPKLARVMDKFAIIRSLADSEGSHDGYQCMTGRSRRKPVPAGDWPNYGSYVSQLQGPVRQGVPANLSLMYPSPLRGWGDPLTGGFLGAAHTPISLVQRDPMARPTNMTLRGITLERLRNRRQLLDATDNFRREVDNSGVIESMDNFDRQAMSIVSSSGLAEALDLSTEDPRVVERYGTNDPAYLRDGAPRMIRNFLVALRLVEAGARVVTLNYARWDWHGPDGFNFPRSREEFPLLDHGLAAMFTDLHDRGLDKDVSIVVWGEFGRTPRINAHNSRDHWPQVSFALLAGGGMNTGQVIGATDRFGEEIADRPVKFQEVFATLYHNIGIDLNTAQVTDLHGRPQFLVDAGIEPISELI